MKAELIDKMGTDESVVRAAKVSFAADGSGITRPAQARLINYLATHNHWTPFAHVRLTVKTHTTIISSPPSETLRAGLVIKKDGTKVRTSLVGWVNLLKADLIDGHYAQGLIDALFTICPLSADAYKLKSFRCGKTSYDWPVTIIEQETETDPEFIDVTLRMCAPVPIRTQCFKHKVGFVENEESRRYISGTPIVFLPEVWRAAPTGNKKQGSDGPLDNVSQAIVSDLYQNSTEIALGAYEAMLAQGVSPEQARFVLPQGCEVNWYWTGNLMSFARFYNQRTDSHAQGEITELAETVGEIIAPLFPMAWPLLTNK